MVKILLRDFAICLVAVMVIADKHFVHLIPKAIATKSEIHLLPLGVSNVHPVGLRRSNNRL